LQNEATLGRLSFNERKTNYIEIKRMGIKEIKLVNIHNFSFESGNFNYLVSILNADNKINIEIAERIAKGNKAYYPNAKINKIELPKEKHQNENI
jgi:hypothetical protein